jgi:hypothetical protein
MFHGSVLVSAAPFAPPISGNGGDQTGGLGVGA